MAEIRTHERWMVYGERQGVPSYIHTDSRSAHDEAKRLARKHGGVTFYVLKAEHGYLLAEPPLTDVIIDPDEPPF